MDYIRFPAFSQGILFITEASIPLFSRLGAKIMVSQNGTSHYSKSNSKLQVPMNPTIINKSTRIQPSTNIPYSDVTHSIQHSITTTIL